MTIKVPSWLIFVVLIGLGLILFSSIRGCHNGQSAVAEGIELHNYNDSLSKVVVNLQHVIDSTKKDYQDSLDFVNGQLALKNNQLTSTRYSLDSADKRITILISKHQDIQPAKDTSITTVPNDFVNECHDCFTELKGGQQKVRLYLSQLDSVKNATSTKLKIQQNRIAQLDKQNSQLASTVQDCITASKAAEKKLTPHGQLYLSGNILWMPYPVGINGGFLYQNKHKLMYGARYGYTKWGNMVETEVNLPLSLNRK